MKQNTKVSQEHPQHDRENQELLATYTLRELTQEEDHPFEHSKPIIAYQGRYHHNAKINSWNNEQVSLPKESRSCKAIGPKVPQVSHQRKLKRKLYEHTSTTLLQLTQSLEISTQKARGSHTAKERQQNRITPLNSSSARNKMLLNRLKKQRSHLSSHLIPQYSLEQAIRITELTKSKNKESSAIKKLKCELIQKTQLKDETSKANLNSFNTSKVRFSLQPREEKVHNNRYVTVEGDSEVAEPKQKQRKRMLRTLYNSAVKQPKKDVKYSRVYTLQRSDPQRGLVCSQEFKVLINLLKKENRSENIRQYS